LTVSGVYLVGLAIGGALHYPNASSVCRNKSFNR
jgi:hypothetical protein